MLEKFQTQKDRTANSADELIGMDASPTADHVPDPELEAVQDVATMRFLDQLLAGHKPDEFPDEDEDDSVDADANVQGPDAGTAEFSSYINDQIS